MPTTRNSDTSGISSRWHYISALVAVRSTLIGCTEGPARRVALCKRHHRPPMGADRAADPPPASCGWRRASSLLEVVNAIFYAAQSGCQWRMLPKWRPPFTTVQRYVCAWHDNGTWQRFGVPHPSCRLLPNDRRQRQPYRCQTSGIPARFLMMPRRSIR